MPNDELRRKAEKWARERSGYLPGSQVVAMLVEFTASVLAEREDGGGDPPLPEWAQPDAEPFDGYTNATERWRQAFEDALRCDWFVRFPVGICPFGDPGGHDCTITDGHRLQHALGAHIRPSLPDKSPPGFVRVRVMVVTSDDGSPPTARIAGDTDRAGDKTWFHVNTRRTIVVADVECPEAPAEVVGVVEPKP